MEVFELVLEAFDVFFFAFAERPLGGSILGSAALGVAVSGRCEGVDLWGWCSY